MHNPSLILVGGGGHCKSCIDVIETTNRWQITGILEKSATEVEPILGYPIIGTDEDLDKLIEEKATFLVTVGQIKSSSLRRSLFETLRSRGAKVATVISKYAIVSKSARIGQGSVLHHLVSVNADAVIGENCIINTGAKIEHDTRIGSHTHVSTNCCINGNVIVGDDCFIGSNSTIANGLSIGNQVVIGANSLVLRDILEPGTYVGSPCRKIS